MKPTGDVAPWIESLARVGYTAKGILYITIGYLAAKAGLGQGGSVTDTGGAMRQVKHASLGQPLLLVIAVGLLGYAAWRLVEAITDPERRGTDLKGIFMRAGFASTMPTLVDRSPWLASRGGSTTTRLKSACTSSAAPGKAPSVARVSTSA